jgi:hypothetical protein
MYRPCSFRLLVPGVVALALGLALGVASAQPRYDRDGYRYGSSEDCHHYAQEQAYRYAPPGSGSMESAARGVIGGAVFSGIVGGGRGAGRGLAAVIGFAVAFTLHQAGA